MAFEQFSIKLPKAYIDYIKGIAGKEDESQGYMVQQLIYGEGNPKLPVPQRRDNRKEQVND